jgi:hypothetical protein
MNGPILRMLAFLALSGLTAIPPGGPAHTRGAPIAHFRVDGQERRRFSPRNRPAPDKISGVVLDMNDHPVRASRSALRGPRTLLRSADRRSRSYEFMAAYDASAGRHLWFVARAVWWPGDRPAREQVWSMGSSRAASAGDLTPGHQFRVYLFGPRTGTRNWPSWTACPRRPRAGGRAPLPCAPSARARSARGPA